MEDQGQRPSEGAVSDPADAEEFSPAQQAFVDRHANVHRRGEAIQDEIQRLQSERSLSKAKRKAVRKAGPLYESMIQGFQEMRRLTDRIPEEEPAAQAVMEQLERVMASLEQTQTRLEQLLELR